MVAAANNPPSRLTGRLSAEHAQELHDRGISSRRLTTLDVETAFSWKRLKELEFALQGARPGGIALGTKSLGGRDGCLVYQPAHPVVANGREVQFVVQNGRRPPVHVPDLTRRGVLDPHQPLVVATNPFDAEAAAEGGRAVLGLAGIEGGFRRRGKQTVAVAEWDQIPLDDREVVIAAAENLWQSSRHVLAAKRLATELRRRGARVRVLCLHGADDQRRTIREVLSGQVATNTVDASELVERCPTPLGDEYEMGVDGTCLVRPNAKGEIERVPLANFSARVVEEIERHDTDGTVRRLLKIVAMVGERVVEFELTAEEFDRMGWIVPCLGSGACLEPGYQVKERLRAAIQQLSTPRLVEEHCRTGWLRTSGGWVYLTAEGPIGSLRTGADPSATPDRPTENGDEPADSTLSRSFRSLRSVQSETRPSIRAHLDPPLDAFRLPPPIDSTDDADNALRDTIPMRLLEELDCPAVAVLVCGMLRSLLGSNRFSIFLVGASGSRKTTLALLLMQFFGRRFGRNHPCFSWESTANAIEAGVAAVHDGLALVDDYVPGNAGSDVRDLERKAERILRGVGNNTGRARAIQTGGLRAARRLHALVLATGEDAPRGGSVQARTVITRLDADDLDLKRLSEQQRIAREGHFTRFTASYVQWLAGEGERRRSDGIREQSYDNIADYVRSLHPNLHSRQQENLAELLLGHLTYLEFVAEKGRIERKEIVPSLKRMAERLSPVFVEQLELAKEEDIAEQFVRSLNMAFIQGAAHVICASQGEPLPGVLAPYKWGYVRESRLLPADDPPPTDVDAADANPQHHDGPAAQYVEHERWRPHGEKIGWFDRGELYLLPDAAHAVVRKIAQKVGATFEVRPLTLARRLVERGVVLRDTRDNRIRTRQTLDGKEISVWKIQFAKLCWENEAGVPPKPEGCSCDWDYNDPNTACTCGAAEQQITVA